MKSLSAVGLSATTTGRLSVATGPYVVHHHIHLPAGRSVTLRCGQVTSVCVHFCGNRPTPASWTEVTVIFVQTNAEESCPVAAVLFRFLYWSLSFFFYSYKSASIVTNLVTLNAISVLFRSVYTTPKTVSKEIRRDELCVLYFVLTFCSMSCSCKKKKIQNSI